MTEACDEEGLTPQGSAWIPGLVLVQGVLGDGGRRIWPHEKPGEYMEMYSQDINPQSTVTNDPIWHGMSMVG